MNEIFKVNLCEVLVVLNDQHMYHLINHKMSFDVSGGSLYCRVLEYNHKPCYHIYWTLGNVWKSKTGFWAKVVHSLHFHFLMLWNRITLLFMVIIWLMLNWWYSYNWCFRYQIIYGALSTVGVGSWMFHMTLQYEMQLLDELPMIWGGYIR